MGTSVEGQPGVWVLLIERGVELGADLSLFWRETAASAAAREYLASAWPGDGESAPSDVQEAIEIYNQLPGAEEHVLLAPCPITGHQFFDGDQDTRPRCGVCGEPLELAGVEDPEAWVHADDANDSGDHTAEVDRAISLPTEEDIA